MSTQKGSGSRTRPQKHQNRTAFKNSLHDTSHKTKQINSLTVSEVCTRCKEIIEWKIKYKKYKPLTQPAKCSKCGNRGIKRAYHTVCRECAEKLGICAKCAKGKEIVPTPPTQEEQFQLDNEMREMLKSLPERRRRTFIRYMNKNMPTGDKSTDQEEKTVKGEKQSKDDVRKDLMDKLNSLKIGEDDDDYFDDSDLDNEEESSLESEDHKVKQKDISY